MQIHDEQDIYDNTAASVTLFRARTNTLLLGITRCTRGDARSFFCTYKMYLYAQNEISYEYN